MYPVYVRRYNSVPFDAVAMTYCRTETCQETDKSEKVWALRSFAKLIKFAVFTINAFTYKF